MIRHKIFLTGLIVTTTLVFVTLYGSEAEAGCGSNGPPPSLSTFKSVDPTLIWLEGTGSPDEATVTLTVTAGYFPVDTLPVDVVLVMDRSGSMAGQKMIDAKNAATYFCSLLISNYDQSGLASFNDTASLDQELTYDHSLTMAAIDSLVVGGGTKIGYGIREAQGELTSIRHRTGVVPVMVLLSDGVDGGSNPRSEADIAKAQGTVIYSIGLGWGVDEQLLKDIASDPDSEYYYYAPTSSDLDSIFGRIHSHISSNVFATQTFFHEILAPNIHYVPGSFSVDPISVSGDTAVWDLGIMRIDESWAVTFNITASDTGHLPVDDYPNAEVNYINCLDMPENVPFPQAYIDVIAPTVGIEEEMVIGEGDGVFLRTSPNPFSFTTTTHGLPLSPYRFTTS
jgi:uncharacterized protein YegL